MLKRLAKLVHESAVEIAVHRVYPVAFAIHIAVAKVVSRAWLRKRSSKELSLAKVHKVLIVRLDEIGDGVLNTPFLRELRRALPQAKITLLVNRRVHPLFAECPYVDEVLPFDTSGRFRKKLFVMPWRALRFATSHLVKQRFDLAVLPRREFDINGSIFLAFFSRATWRVAYTEHVNARKHRLNPYSDRLLTNAIDPLVRCQHEVDFNLDIIRFLGGEPQSDALELWTSTEDECVADKLLGPQAAGIPLIGISPGSSTWLRRWPAEYFASLVEELQRTHGCRFVVVGASEERGIGEIIAAGNSNVINLAGRTTLSQCAAVLRRCDLVVANDSGPMHIAAAMGVKVVALYGSTCEHRFGPWKNRSIVTLDYPCRPCNQGHVIDSCGRCVFDAPRCLTEMTVDTVLTAVEAAMVEEATATKVPKAVSS